MSCHSDSGQGGMGLSINEIAHEKSGASLIDFLEYPRNRAMREAYNAHPITEAEAWAIALHLLTVSRPTRGRNDDDGEHNENHRHRRIFQHEDDD